METIADLHIHSKYSRAVSRSMDLETIAVWAQKKGIGLTTTADFTHPAWFAELKKKLGLQKNGLYQLKARENKMHFMLTTELSCIYSKGGKGRRIHLVIIMPTLEAVDTLNGLLTIEGSNLRSDGRPILGIDAERVVELVLRASPDAVVIPAHIWTPWFSMFGSQSGFNTVEECFGQQTKNIFAIETGLSSDPPMNWRLSQLDRYSIVSFSDAHSADKLGREATVFDLETLNYSNIINAIKQTGGQNKIAYTIEFFPEEGKYHWDGHRDCHVRLSPAETKKHHGICLKCKKPLTIGVLNRVDALADRPEGYQPTNRPPFKSLVPLKEIIAETLDQGVNTKAVAAEYESLIKQGTSEFNVLLNIPIEKLRTITTSTVAEAIGRVRAGNIMVLPGYDGEFGTVKVFKDKPKTPQSKLF